MGKHYKQLSIEERTLIQTQLAIGVKPAAIAKGLGRCVSTISRELKRNGWVRPKSQRARGRPLLAGGYRCEEAHRRAQACTAKVYGMAQRPPSLLNRERSPARSCLPATPNPPH